MFKVKPIFKVKQPGLAFYVIVHRASLEVYGGKKNNKKTPYLKEIKQAVVLKELNIIFSRSKQSSCFKISVKVSSFNSQL
jgi:hypothetical protein